MNKEIEQLENNLFDCQNYYEKKLKEIEEEIIFSDVSLREIIKQIFAKHTHQSQPYPKGERVADTEGDFLRSRTDETPSLKEKEKGE